MTKTKIALAAALFAATSSAAFAQGFDPDLSNRYQSYAAPSVYGYSAAGRLGTLQSAPSATFQSSSVALRKHGNARLESTQVRLHERNVSLPAEGPSASGPFWYGASGPTTGGM